MEVAVSGKMEKGGVLSKEPAPVLWDSRVFPGRWGCLAGMCFSMDSCVGGRVCLDVICELVLEHYFPN